MFHLLCFLSSTPWPQASPCWPPSCRLPSVFLFPAAVYHVTPAAARRAFRRVPSRHELPLQVVCFLAFAAPVSGPLAFTRGRDRARARAVLAACVETVGPADAVWALRCKGTEVPQARVRVLLLAGPTCHEVSSKCFSLLCFHSLQLSHWLLAIVFHSFVSADL